MSATKVLPVLGNKEVIIVELTRSTLLGRVIIRSLTFFDATLDWAKHTFDHSNFLLRLFLHGLVNLLLLRSESNF